MPNGQQQRPEDEAAPADRAQVVAPSDEQAQAQPARAARAGAGRRRRRRVGGHRTACRARVAGDGADEDLVEVGCLDREALDLCAGGGQLAEQVARRRTRREQVAHRAVGRCVPP